MPTAAVVALLAGVAGCSESRSQPPARVLRLATANPAGVAHDPALRVFAARVARLSGGRLRISFDDRWGRDGNAHEVPMLRGLAAGSDDLAIAHTRSLARAGARDMEAL